MVITASQMNDSVFWIIVSTMILYGKLRETNGWRDRNVDSKKEAFCPSVLAWRALAAWWLVAGGWLAGGWQSTPVLNGKLVTHALSILILMCSLLTDVGFYEQFTSCSAA